MSEVALYGVPVAPWALVSAGFIFGLAIGWLFWSGRGADRSQRMEEAGAVGARDTAVKGAPVEFGVVEAELRKARDLLDADKADETAIAEDLDALDAAVNRANGRLKVIAKSVRKALGD